MRDLGLPREGERHHAKSVGLTRRVGEMVELAAAECRMRMAKVFLCGDFTVRAQRMHTPMKINFVNR
jgi:hypothetical protein